MGPWAAIQIGLGVGSFLVGAYMRDRNRKAYERLKELNEWGVPSAREGAPVPVLIGRYRVTGGVFGWVGQPNDVAIRVNGTQVARDYRLPFFLATCHPCNPNYSRLHRIYFDDRAIFGDATTTLAPDYYNNDTEITSAVMTAAGANLDSLKTTYGHDIDIIGRDEIYGGKGQGGGIAGVIEWLPGSTDQFLGPWWAIRLFSVELSGGGDVSLNPPHRRMSGLYFDGLHPSTPELVVGFGLGESGQFPNISTDQTSIPDALGYGAIGDDANPAEAIYAILTDTYWGRGLDASLIDIASFQAAAATLESEAHGYSQLFGSANDLGAVLDEIKAQIVCVLYEDVTTRKIGLKLIRDDYDIGTVEAFDETNVDLVDYSPASWGDTVNEVIVTYSDREKDYENTSSEPARDDASIVASGEPSRTATVSYPGCTNGGLAKKLAYRDLRFLSVPLARLRIVVSRDAYAVRAGDVISFSWAKYGLSGVGFRVVRVNLGTREDGLITLECIQDHFSFGESIFPDVVRPDVLVAPVGTVTTGLVMETPRWMNTHDTVTLTDPETPRLLYLAQAPATGTNDFFHAETSDDAGVTFDRDRAGCPFRATALVETAYAKELEPMDTTTGLRIKTVSSVSALQNVGDDFDIYIRGANFLLVGGASGEIIAYEDFTDEGGGVYTLNNVWRGMLDTVPADHAVDAPIWFLNPYSPLHAAYESRNLGRTARSSAASYASRLLSANAWGSESIDDALELDSATVNRALRPMPVDDLQLEGLKTGTLLEDYLTYTWLRRRRVTTTAYRGTDTDALEAGDLFKASGRIVGDGAYTPEAAASFQVVTDDIDGVTVTQPHGRIGHGDAELRVTAFRQPYDWNALEVDDFQSATWDFHLHRVRQLLANPSFVDGLNNWTLVGDTPLLTDPGVDGAAGSVGGGNGTYDYTVTQIVDIRGWSTPKGLVARLRGYHLLNGVATQETSITALDSSQTPIGSAATTGALTGSGWQLFDVAKTLPAGTEYLRIRCESVDGFEVDDPTVSDLDLRIGQSTAQLLTNPDFDSATTGWTVSSGTWAITTGSKLAGSGSLRYTTAGTAEIYQEQNITAGYEQGTAHLQAWRTNTGNDELKLVLEARTAGGSVVSSVETSAVLANDGEWHRDDLYLDLDDPTIAALRVRVVGTVNPTGGNSVFTDAMRMHVHKELHPTKQHTVMTFDNTPVQVFPERAIDWVNDYGAPEPSAIYTFDDVGWPIQNKIPTATPASSALREAGSNDVRLAQVCAGFRDAAGSYAAKACMEVPAGGVYGARFNTLTDLSVDGVNSWAVLVAFRILGNAAECGIMGSRDETTAQGWEVRYAGTIDGRLRMFVIDDVAATSLINMQGTEYGNGSLHYAVMKYNATTGQVRSWTNQDTPGNVAIPAGNCSNIEKAILGATPDTTSGDVQIAYSIRWDGAAAEALSETHTNAWWTHATDPSGELTQYDSVVPIAGPVDSDADGVVIAAYSAGGQLAIFEDAALTTHGRGISAHRDLINLVNPDPIAAEWTAFGITATDRAGVDAMRMYRAVELTGISTQWYKSAAITAAAGDVTVVAYLKADNPTSGLSARILLTDSADNVVALQSFAHSTINGWTRVEKTLAWSGVTASFHVGIAASITAGSGTIQMSMPIGVYYGATGTTFAPIAVHLADSGGSNKAIIRRDTALDARYNHEGEVAVTGLIVDIPQGVSIADITNGTNNNDRRRLAINGTLDNQFIHYTGAGVGSNAIVVTPSWSGEWTVRGRWNTGGLMEDTAQFSSTSGQGSTDYDRVATWTPSAVPLDTAIFGDDLGGLISQIVLAAREFNE